MKKLLPLILCFLLLSGCAGESGQTTPVKTPAEEKTVITPGSTATVSPPIRVEESFETREDLLNFTAAIDPKTYPEDGSAPSGLLEPLASQIQEDGYMVAVDAKDGLKSEQDYYYEISSANGYFGQHYTIIDALVENVAIGCEVSYIPAGREKYVEAGIEAYMAKCYPGYARSDNWKESGNVLNCYMATVMINGEELPCSVVIPAIGAPMIRLFWDGKIISICAVGQDDMDLTLFEHLTLEKVPLPPKEEAQLWLQEWKQGAQNTEDPETMMQPLLYDYFRDHARQVSSLLSFTAKDASNDDLMVFARQNLPDEFDAERGIPKSHIDEILNKYFGRTVTAYDTDYTDVLPSGNVRATAFSVQGCYRMVLQKLTQAEEDYTGLFDVYYFPEGEPVLPDIDSDLRAGRTENWAKYFSCRAEITFEKVPAAAEPQGFYLKYHSAGFHCTDSLLYDDRPVYRYRDELLLHGAELDSTKRDWVAWYDKMTPIEEFAIDAAWSYTNENTEQMTAEIETASGRLKIEQLEQNGYCSDYKLSLNGETDTVYFDNYRRSEVVKLYRGDEYLLMLEAGPSDDPAAYLWRLTGGLDYLGCVGGEDLRCDEEWRIVSGSINTGWGELKENPIFSWCILGDTIRVIYADPLLFEGVTYTAAHNMGYFTGSAWDFDIIPAGEKLTLNSLYSTFCFFPDYWQVTRQNGEKQMIVPLFGD